MDPNESILISIGSLIGIGEEYEHFDPNLIIFINTAFMNLNQLGIGPPSGFNINSKEDTWESILNGREDLAAIKAYVYLKVRLLFDPPQTGYLVEAIKDQIKELEWRLNAQAEGGTTNG